VILRPAPSARWVTLLFLLVLAGGLLGLGFRGWIIRFGDIWAPSVVAALLVAMGYLYWNMKIQADDTTIVVRLGVTRVYDVLFTTLLYWWGKDQMDALARFLGVPIT
jgi:hypothetical protein